MLPLVDRQVRHPRGREAAGGVQGAAAAEEQPLPRLLRRTPDAAALLFLLLPSPRLLANSTCSGQGRSGCVCCWSLCGWTLFGFLLLVGVNLSGGQEQLNVLVYIHTYVAGHLVLSCLSESTYMSSHQGRSRCDGVHIYIYLWGWTYIHLVCSPWSKPTQWSERRSG